MLFVQLFKEGGKDPSRDSFDNYYMSLVEIKGFNVLINNKPYFEETTKNKQEAYENIAKMSRNKYFTKGNLLD